MAETWLDAVCRRLRELPEDPGRRILIAEEGGRLRAVLGLIVQWTGNGGPRRARICVLGAAPGHRRAVVALLVRFAEGLARVHGCQVVEVVDQAAVWGGSDCWSGLGYHEEPSGTSKVLPTARCERCL
jgi:hypothetical protein